MRFAPFYLSRLRADRHFHHPKSMLKAAKNHLLKLLLAPKHVCFQSKVMIKRSNSSALIYTCARHLPHITPRFGAFYTAFWCILHCVLHHITSRLAAKRTAFSGILHCILLQIASRAIEIAYWCNKKWGCIHVYATPFCIKNNSRKNRLIAAEWTIGWKNGSH